jgi:hypothetical protein
MSAMTFAWCDRLGRRRRCLALAGTRRIVGERRCGRLVVIRIAYQVGHTPGVLAGAPVLDRPGLAHVRPPARTFRGHRVDPGFDSYQRFTDRQIPVAVLERRDVS